MVDHLVALYSVVGANGAPWASVLHPVFIKQKYICMLMWMVPFIDAIHGMAWTRGVGSRTDLGSIWVMVRIWCERDFEVCKRKGFVKSRLLGLLKERASLRDRWRALHTRASVWHCTWRRHYGMAISYFESWKSYMTRRRVATRNVHYKGTPVRHP